MKAIVWGSVLAIAVAGTAVAQDHGRGSEAEKLADDPTKIVTKLGLRYTEYATVSGSIAFGPVSKVNASVSQEGEWSLGGSYLFRFGIVNAAASEKKLSNGTTQTQYSIGSYIPLSALIGATGKWQVFPMFGFNYTEGQNVETDVMLTDDPIAATTSKGGYVGLFALRPLNEDWTFKGAIVTSKGSGDYSGYSIGGGISYALTKRDSLGIFASYADNSYGEREFFGISYKREF
ncbi:MAG: hypothetical protein ABJQ23_06830 [Shimia thalassica]|uniref:hypothetical protein n=1 Tax=Shimia thalassica TaxID=1715693 RepID=UPI00329861BB